jgi:HK97 family phage major capsid protein
MQGTKNMGKETEDTTALESAIVKAVELAVGPRLEALEKSARVKATSNMGDVSETTEEPARPFHTSQKNAAEGTGLNFARWAKAELVSRLNGISADSVLDAWGYPHIQAARTKSIGDRAKQRALGTNVLADGGALVPVEFSTEVIELLRNQTAVRKLGARVIQMTGSMDFPEQTAAGTAAYVGENTDVAPSQLTTGSARLIEKKLMALTPLSNDLIRNASVGAEQMVRDDLVQVMALKEDLQAMFGVGSQYSPRGIESQIATANLYAATAVDPKAPTLAEVKKEISKAKKFMTINNVPKISMGWIMGPRTLEYLESITDGNGNSIYAAGLDAGMLAGAPFICTNQVPENLNTDESRLFYGDFAQFIIAESMGLEVEFFPNAAWDNSGTIVSGVSRDQSVVRTISKHDFLCRYRTAFVEIKVRWGAP